MLNGLVVLAVLLSGASAVAADTSCTMHVGWWIYPDKTDDVWLSERHCGDLKHWELTAKNRALLARAPVPPLRKGHRFNYGQCKLKGVLRNDIIATVRHNKDVEWSTEVSRAWLLDPTGKAIKPISPDGLSCRYDGYGL